MTEPESTPVNEAWICQIPGRISLALEDLITGRKRTITTVGKGSVLRLTDKQRELVEEQVVFPEHNPFRNGMLVRKSADGAKSDQELADDELAALFEMEDRDFAEVAENLSEVNVRRLYALAKERNASFNQVGALGDMIEERWPMPEPGKTQEEIYSIGVQ